MTGLSSPPQTDRRTCVLVCDPETDVRNMMRAAFARRDALHVLEAEDLAAAMPLAVRCSAALLAAEHPEDATRRLRASGFAGTLVVALARGSSVTEAVAAMRAGADDVVIKPIGPEDVVDRLLAATPARRPERRRRDRPQLPRNGDFCGFLGRSRAMQAVYAQIERLAASRAPVFVTGESGTGKALAAAALHMASTRQQGPFNALNCSAIPASYMEQAVFGLTGPGAIERAHGGTLLLDEVAELNAVTQSKLLNFLEKGRFRRAGETDERTSDVRLVCATSRDPQDDVASGRLREDLFYRLNVLTLSLPPLRERDDDVILLAEAFLARFAGEEGRPISRLGPGAADVLRARPFRGNVRELQNLMRRAVILGDGGELGPELFEEPEPTHHAEAPSLHAHAMLSGSGHGGMIGQVEPFAIIERRVIEAAIAAFDGNIPLAAAALDLSPSTLYRKKLAWQERRRLS
ncbi:sigma-54 dependent transcriptional regulator [Xanthobacter autotrophicus]|uniref:sigma-54-dependent transcriptional regulator n=1 Tax=Xanthobacter TaxID=279 RepID=UPI0024ABAF0B|nr:sigma-54 dependent transcriptional regulator [Xanthobacter autotrophicus]MDI4664232.1 sigma-54 dependent transcriptional regulator [Xanthobacter autotrophicus]